MRITDEIVAVNSTLKHWGCSVHHKESFSSKIFIWPKYFICCGVPLCYMFDYWLYVYFQTTNNFILWARKWLVHQMSSAMSLFSQAECLIIWPLATTTLEFIYLLTSFKLDVSLTLALVLPVKMSCHVIELAAVAHKEMSCSASRVNQEKQVEYLEDKLFGHLPSKLWSAEVAIRSCLLVDWPLQVQFPRGEYRTNATREKRQSAHHRTLPVLFFQFLFL